MMMMRVHPSLLILKCPWMINDNINNRRASNMEVIQQMAEALNR